MLIWTLSFLTLGLLAGAIGFAGQASTKPSVSATTATGMARALFFVFLFGFVVTMVLGLVQGF